MGYLQLHLLLIRYLHRYHHRSNHSTLEGFLVLLQYLATLLDPGNCVDSCQLPVIVYVEMYHPLPCCVTCASVLALNEISFGAAGISY